MNIGGTELPGDTFVATMSSDKEILDVKSMTRRVRVPVIHARDSMENELVAFAFDDDIEFQGTRITSSEYNDIAVFKLKSDGTPLWWRRASGGAESLDALAVGRNDDVLVAGTSYFASGVGIAGVVAKANPNLATLFLAKMNAAGIGEWAKSVQFERDPAVESGPSSAVFSKPGNSVIWSGAFSGAQQLGSHRIVSTGGNDAFVARIAGDGEVLWVKTFGGPGNQFATSVETDSADNVFVAGYFYGEITIGPWTLESRGAEDLFLAKLEPDGSPAWVKHLGYTGKDRYVDLEITRNGELLVAGAFSGGLLIDGEFIQGSSQVDGFIAKFEAEASLPEFAMPLESQVASFGMSVTLRAEVLSPTPVSLQWWFNGLPLPGETNSSLVLPSIGQSQAGSYFVVARNEWGSVESNPATITYTDASTLKLSIHPTLTIYGMPGKTYRIDYAAETKTPANWITLTNLVLSTSPQIWVDVNATIRDQRYYRVLLQAGE